MADELLMANKTNGTFDESASLEGESYEFPIVGIGAWSSVEEVQSSNEELQSTNEELETAKEELRSSNEELQTLNEELKNRNQTLGRLNDDLANLQTNIDITVVIVDSSLRIRRFTAAAQDLLRISPSYVWGLYCQRDSGSSYRGLGKGDN